MKLDRIYVFDGDKKGNRRLGKGIRRYDLDSYLAGVREGFGPDLYDQVTVECKRDEYSWDYPVVIAFVATDVPQARADFLHFCKILGHGPTDVTFVTQNQYGLVSTHKTLAGAIARAERDGTFADFYPLED
jgi:hypothetical protein